MSSITGPAAAALESLTPSQLLFIQSLPKAELHAHLNGSIPIAVLQELALEYIDSDPGSPSQSSRSLSNDVVEAGIEKLLAGPSIVEIADFFDLFPAIYALTAAPSALARATYAVLSTFLDGEYPQCTYLELRTTPKETPEMTREQYLRVVVGELNRHSGVNRVGLIVSMDRRMDEATLRECLDLAKKLKEEGEPVVGVDLCGDPMSGDMALFHKYFDEAKAAGLGVTLHIAEVCVIFPSLIGLLSTACCLDRTKPSARNPAALIVPTRPAGARHFPRRRSQEARCGAKYLH